MTENGYKTKGYSFKAKIEGTCAICKFDIQIGNKITKLNRSIRNDAPGANVVPMYVVRSYAHEECTKPQAPKTCPTHGQSLYSAEEDCPVCGIQLRQTG